MRRNPTKKIEQYRVTTGQMRSSKEDGANGAFILPSVTFLKGAELTTEAVADSHGEWLKVIVSDGSGWRDADLPGNPWEHVSVSCEQRCPRWLEMELVKRIFWRSDETVIQFHVPTAKHINYHPHCLHMWRPIGVVIPMPPSITVGPSDAT